VRKRKKAGINAKGRSVLGAGWGNENEWEGKGLGNNKDARAGKEETKERKKSEYCAKKHGEE